MIIEVVITQDGQLGLFSKEGTFTDGSRALRDLLSALQSGRVDLDEVGEVEQHRHETEAAPTTIPLAAV